MSLEHDRTGADERDPDRQGPRTLETAERIAGETSARVRDVVTEPTSHSPTPTSPMEHVEHADEQHEIFESPEHFIERLNEDARVNRELYMAFLIDENESRVWSNHPHRMCCADGRIDDVRHFRKAMAHRRFAQEYDPQAGILLLAGVEKLHTKEEFDAYYEQNRERIAEVLYFRFMDRIRKEFAWQKRFIAEKRAKLARLEAAGDGFTNTAKRLRDQIETVKNKTYRILLQSHSTSDEYLGLSPEDPHYAEAVRHAASHGCGAHKSNMRDALSHTVKIAYMIDRWIHDTHPKDPVTGNEAPNFTPEELEKIRIIRTHNFTDEAHVVRATTVDGKALDTEGNISPVPDHLRELGTRYVPRPTEYDVERKAPSDTIITHNYEEHDEQIVRISGQNRAYSIPDQSVLEMGWSKNLDLTAEILGVLLNIAENNFGKHHPDKPLFLHIDIPFDPGYVKEVMWGTSERALAVRAAFETKQPIELTAPQNLEGPEPAVRIPSALDVIREGREIVTFEKRYVSGKEKERLERRNESYRKMKEDLLARLEGILARPELADIRDRTEFIVSSTNTQNLKGRVRHFIPGVTPIHVTPPLETIS